MPLLHNLLKQKNPYYSNLSLDQQTRFQKRVLRFMESKMLVGRGGFIVTDEIKVLISASAIQLTFGLSGYLISHFHTINIFPRSFFSKLYNTAFKGLTTQGGVLSISWNDFQEGYANGSDKLNLGLHELAHALNIDQDEEGNYDEHFSDYFETWKEAAMYDFLKLKEGKTTFLRNYAATNMHEFFAVSIEHFFESPDEFQKQLPNLYTHTAILLNQDPRNVSNDYQLYGNINYSAAATIPSVRETSLDTLSESNNLYSENIYYQTNGLQKFLKTKGVYVAMAATLLGLFIGIPLLFWFASVTVISIGTIMLMVFGCGALGLLQWKYVKGYLDMEYHQFSMYAFTGFGMCLINFILFLNFIIPLTTHTETYTISKVSYYNYNYEIVLAGENSNGALVGGLENYFTNHSIQPYESNITVAFNTGLFGFDIIKECNFN